MCWKSYARQNSGNAYLQQINNSDSESNDQLKDRWKSTTTSAILISSPTRSKQHFLSRLGQILARCEGVYEARRAQVALAPSHRPAQHSGSRNTNQKSPFRRIRNAPHDEPKRASAVSSQFSSQDLSTIGSRADKGPLVAAWESPAATFLGIFPLGVSRA